MHIDVEWDSKKASSNLEKHGVGFNEEAVLVEHRSGDREQGIELLGK